MFRSFWLLTLVACLSTFLGCGGGQQPDPNKPAAHHEGDGHDHGHASEGPHRGTLVELGKEEYHAEVVHDDAAGTVTIYLLDSAAKKAVPIDAPEVLINLTHDGNAEQFKLAASPDQGDPEGKSSRFVSSDKELSEDLDAKGTKPQLVVVIDGKQFRGDIAHDHEGHEHK